MAKLICGILVDSVLLFSLGIFVAQNTIGINLSVIGKLYSVSFMLITFVTLIQLGVPLILIELEFGLNQTIFCG